MMSSKLALQLHAPALAGSTRIRTRRGDRASHLVVRASDDEDIIPIITGRKKKDFTQKEYEMLRHPHLMGGKTIGDELAIIRSKYVEAEENASETLHTKVVSANWDGDVYIGKQWNELSILYLIFMLSPALVGLFAWLSYGTLWGVDPFYM